LSTVLWANLLLAGEVKSAESDLSALYKHGERLDQLAKKLDQPSFLGICDTTDMRFNADEFTLPEGVDSTDVVMAKEGVWIELNTARRMLEALVGEIRGANIRFGLFQNQQAQVLEELSEVLSFIQEAPPAAEKFNFSIVA
jgi:hypothetical protein